MGLTLQRERDESVVLILEDGREINVTVADVRSRGRVRLNFEAPKSIAVHRSEIWAEKLAAARVRPTVAEARRSVEAALVK